MVSGFNNNMPHMYKGSGPVELCKFSCGEYIYSAKPGHIILLVNNLI